MGEEGRRGGGDVRGRRGRASLCSSWEGDARWLDGVAHRVRSFVSKARSNQKTEGNGSFVGSCELCSVAGIGSSKPSLVRNYVLPPSGRFPLRVQAAHKFSLRRKLKIGPPSTATSTYIESHTAITLINR